MAIFGGVMGNSKRSVLKEHFVQVKISHSLKSKVLALAKEYDKTAADVLRGALSFGVPILEGLRLTEKEFVRAYLKELKSEVTKMRREDGGKRRQETGNRG